MVAAGAILLAGPAHAQSARSLVLVRGRDPLPPVVTTPDRSTVASEAPGFLVLVDMRGEELARAPVDTLRFNALLAPTPGRYRLNVERVGYRSTTSQTFQVDVDLIADVRLEYPTEPVALPPMAEATGGCMALGDSDLLAALWGEARKALSAAAWSDGATHEYVATEHDRSWDTSGRLTSERSATTRGKPRFGASDPAGGYVVTGADRTTSYRAPVPERLFASDFAASHCFALARDQTARSGQVGLAFSPGAGSTGSDVRGTLWLDQETLELSAFEFSYTGMAEAEAGGELEVTRVSPGHWLVTRWALRVPRRRLRGGAGVPAGIRELSGQVTSVTPVQSPDRRRIAQAADAGPEVWPTVIDRSLRVGFAQRLAVGVKGGWGRATIGGEQLDAEARHVFHAGGFLAVMPARIFAMQLEGIYARRGAKDPGGRLTVDYVDLPLLFVFHTHPLSHLQAAPGIFFGPTVSYRIRCEVRDLNTQSATDCHDQTAAVGFGLTAGVGVTLRLGAQQFLVEAGYLYGLSKANIEGVRNFDFKHRSVSLSLGLRFPLAGGR
jgi:hypothetical protein